MLSPAAPGSAGAASRRATPSTAGGPVLQLLSQSDWVAPGQRFDLRLAVGSRAPDTRSSTEGVVVTVYDRIITRSAFTLTLSGTVPTGVLARSRLLPLSSLPTPSGGGSAVSVSVAGGGVPAPSGGNLTVQLPCGAGSCGGVYPVRVQLEPLDGRAGPTASFVTHLVVSAAHKQVTDPLRFAWVVPADLPPPTATADGTTRSAGTGTRAGLQGLLTALAGYPSVPLTVSVDGATVEQLTGLPHDQHLLSSLRATVADPSRETLGQSYAPVAASALVAGGLSQDLVSQLQQGRHLVSQLQPAHLGTSTWVATDTLDSPTLSLLGRQQVDHVVVPAAAVAPARCGTGDCVEPFTLEQDSGGGPLAMLSDPGLTADLLAAAGGDPVLAAHRLLADLSFLYYESPNTADAQGTPLPRGVVLATPPNWHPDPTFVSTVLQGLSTSPILSPVTLSTLFATLPVGKVPGQPAQRRPAASPGPGVLPLRQLRRAQGAVDAFAAAVPATGAGVATTQHLSDLLLGAESVVLGTRPAPVLAETGATLRRRQQTAVAGVVAALDTQLRHLSVAGDTIRLTAQSGTVPVTVLRTGSYPIDGTLVVSSDKLVFGTTPGCTPTRPTHPSTGGLTEVVCQVSLTKTSNVVNVLMRTRASGDFRVTVRLTTPDGRLVLLDTHLTVHAMSISAVALALSIGALLILLSWWGRTLWRGRRRGVHSRGARRDVAASRPADPAVAQGSSR
jgi:hypothetical protein